MQKKLLLIILAMGLGISALLGCSPTPPPPAEEEQPASQIEMTDGLDRVIRLEGAAERIVSLAPAITETLYAIGAGTKLVGRDTFSDFPAEALNVPDIGGGFGELNTEVILAQKPDLILAGLLTPPEQIKALEDLGLTVFVLPNPLNFEDMFRIIRLVATLTGQEAEADQLVNDLEKRYAAVTAKTSQVSELPLVFYELDGTDPNAPWTPGPGNFVDTLITLAGGENLGARLSSEWAQISIEELIAQDPDIILIGDATYTGLTLDEVRARAGWSSLTAIQNGNLFTFNDNLVSRPGPRMVEGLEEMAKFLHPELFP